VLCAEETAPLVLKQEIPIIPTQSYILFYVQKNLKVDDSFGNRLKVICIASVTLADYVTNQQ
jgi:hypothetical protein